MFAIKLAHPKGPKFTSTPTKGGGGTKKAGGGLKRLNGGQGLKIVAKGEKSKLVGTGGGARKGGKIKVLGYA